MNQDKKVDAFIGAYLKELVRRKSEFEVKG